MLAVVVVTALIALTNLELQAAAIVKALALHRPVLVSGKGMILVIPALELLAGASVPLASAKGGRLARQLHICSTRENVVDKSHSPLIVHCKRWLSIPRLTPTARGTS